MKDFLYILVILIFLLLWGYERFFDTPQVQTIVKQDTILVRDTIRIEKVKGKITYRIKEQRDTIVVYDSTRYIACFDTSISKSYISVCYNYPENFFSTFIVFKPDTIQKYTIIEKPIMKVETRKDPWYIDAAKISGGIILGFMIGRVR
jgi:hypothetical protein